MTTPTPDPPPRGRRLWRAGVTIAVSAILVTFGVQQAIYQHSASVRDSCVDDYNQEVDRVRDARVSAGADLDTAQQAKEDAGDNVLLGILDLLQAPRDDPEAGQQQVANLTHSLITFVRKRDRRNEVRTETDTTVDQNPYPTLDC